MKILKRIWGIGLLAFLLVTLAPSKGKSQDITEQDFYDNLSPYGTWVSDPQYGDVWVPDVDGDFRPYATEGHWVLTEYGNTWVSDYPWGWATFHYGRWRYDDYYGWEWVPGYQWAPAWVSWRRGGGYYGWAPLMPGISLSLSFGGGYNVPDNYWVCAPAAYINRPNIYNYYVPYARTVTIIHRTTIINNTYSSGGRRYIAGPGVADIQRYTHQRPQVYTISNANRPGAVNVHNTTVNIFRPAVKKAPDARPVRVVDAEAYKQQNPSQNIAHRGSGGAAANNHANAAKLAVVARGTTDSKVVHVNPANNNRVEHPAQQASEHQQPQTQPAATQPGNRPQQSDSRTQQPETGNNNNTQPGTRRGRPENRPNVTPPAQAVTTPANTQPQSQPNQSQPTQQQHRGQQNRQQQNSTVQQPAEVQPQSNQPAVQQQQIQQQVQQAQRQQRQQQRQAQQQQMQQQGQQPQQQQAQQQQVQQQRAQQQQQQAQQPQQQQQQRAQQQQAQQAQQQQVQQQRAQQQQAQQAQQQQAQQQRGQQQQQVQQQRQQQMQQQRQIQQQQRQPPPQQQPKPDDHKQQ